MKVFIDTNILISSALFPGSIPDQAYRKAVKEPNEGIVCDANVDELKKVFARKFPTKTQSLDTFLSSMMLCVTIIRVPAKAVREEEKIRDEKDRPIFRAAITAGADLFLTGDKDFLEADLFDPRIISPAEMLNL